MAGTLGARLRRAFTLATTPPGHDREQRAPKVATGTVSYTTPGFPMYPEWSGAQALAQGYYRNVYVNRALSILAHDIAKLAFRAGATPPENLWDQPDHTPNARLAQLLGPAPKGPNPATSSLTMWSWTVVQFLAAGRFAWEAELSTSGPLDKRDILGLWPMSVQYVNPIPSQGGTGYFSGYEYSPNGTPTRLQPERVVYCWRPSQTDWRQPESALQSASLPVRIATTIDRYHWGLLENRNVPDTLVITPPFAEKEERRAWRDQFTAEYGGASNAGKTMFGEAEAGDEGKAPPIQVHRLAMTTKDAQLLELRAAALNDVSIATGVPKSKLGDASERTFSNAEEESANYQLDTLVPLALELADKINLALSPRLGPEIGWFDLSQLPAVRQLGGKTMAPIGPPPALNPAADPADPTDQPQPGPAAKAPGIPPLAAVGAAAGAEPGESRKITGLARVDDAVDEREVAGCDVPARTTGAGSSAESARSSTVEPRHIPPPEPVDHEARRTKLWTTTDQRIQQLERIWERRFKALFAKQEKATLDRLTGRRGRQMARRVETRDTPPNPGQIFDQAYWASLTAEQASELYEQVVQFAGFRISDRLGIAFDIESPYAQTFIHARANQLAGAVSDTTYKAIQGALSEGTAAGESIEKLASRVQDVFGRADRIRAVRIARTEVISAVNGSTSLVAEQYGEDVVAGQEWLATRDHRTRDTHRAADGQIAATGEMFTVGGYQLKYPGDPSAPGKEVIQCRCTTVVLTPEDMAELGRAALASERRWTPDEALRVLELVEARLIEPGDVPRALEAVA